MPQDATAPQVFLSYAHEDLEKVRRLHQDLMARGVNVWFDKAKLKPGRWRRQIQRAIPRSRFFVICLSQAALRKTGEAPGFTDDELNWAFEIAVAQDERTFTIIPVRLEDCERGDNRLSMWQQHDLFGENWAEKIDQLAVYLGGQPVRRALEAQEEAVQALSEDEQLIESLLGKSKTFLFSGDYQKAPQHR